MSRALLLKTTTTLIASTTKPLARLSALTAQLPRTMSSTSTPTSQTGVSISKNGDVSVLEYTHTLPTPSPAAGQVLVKNNLVGINYIDTYFRSGLYPAPAFPLTLGREAAGTVVALPASGDTYGLQQGDRVAYLSTGAYAQYTAAPAMHTCKLPEGVSDEKAAASLLQGLTALTLIREAHAVQKGDWVLVHAAAGGVGLWLCQLLKAVGARAIGTASTSEKRELARKAGAEVVLEYAADMEGGDKAFVAKVKDLTGGEGVVAVLDGVGKATFDVSLECVARKGSMISFGNASGAVPPLTIARLSAKNVKLLRPTLFNYIATREEFEKLSTELWDIVGGEGFDVKVHKIYDLKDVAQAHLDLEGRKTTGKLLLKV